MKKNLFLAIIGIAIATLCSCGSKIMSKTIKGENGTEYENYREACRDGDFNAAHKFLDRMKEEADDWESNQKVQEAEDYIFNNEVNALISQNSEEANTRVIYLLNEIPIEGTKPSIGEITSGSAYGESCSRFNIKLNKILEVAISTGNQDIAKKILSMYKEDETISDFQVAGYTYDSKEEAQRKYDEAFGEKEEIEEEEIKSTPKGTKKKRR